VAAADGDPRRTVWSPTWASIRADRILFGGLGPRSLPVVPSAQGGGVASPVIAAAEGAESAVTLAIDGSAA
jgi:hypothetical protein